MCPQLTPPNNCRTHDPGCRGTPVNSCDGHDGSEGRRGCAGRLSSYVVVVAPRRPGPGAARREVQTDQVESRFSTRCAAVPRPGHLASFPGGGRDGGIAGVSAPRLGEKSRTWGTEDTLWGEGVGPRLRVLGRAHHDDRHHLGRRPNTIGAGRWLARRPAARRTDAADPHPCQPGPRPPALHAPRRAVRRRRLRARRRSSTGATWPRPPTAGTSLCSCCSWWW